MKLLIEDYQYNAKEIRGYAKPDEWDYFEE